jgi:2-dehydro-3-deoxyphosphooctonate aldolase (KDO 8-P synthase)
MSLSAKAVVVKGPKTEVTFSNTTKLAIMAGPCALESRAHALEMSAALREIAVQKQIGLVYKTSFDKANRTSNKSFRGVGIEQGLEILQEVRETTGLPVMTDVHTEEQCRLVGQVADILQIPAFLCRQTDLLVAAAKTGKAINVKKGQFLAPWDMVNVAQKIAEAGNPNVMLCERGTSFGYNTLVNDMRGLPIMAQTGCPIIFDATHSVAQPGGEGNRSGGDRRFVEPLARAAVAVGVAGVFMETHQDPDKAPSDGPNMLVLKDLPQLLDRLLALDAIAKEFPVVLES